MIKLISPLFILLTFALVSALFVHERQSRDFQAQSVELCRQLLKREQFCKRQAAQIAALEKNQEILKAEAEALRERLRAVASATPEPRPNDAPSPTPSEPKPGFSGMIKQMMADPQMKKIMAKQQTVALRQYYADFAKQAGLAPQEAEKLFELLANRQESMMEAAAGDPKQPRKDFKEDLKALLGDQRAKQLEDFEKTLPDRIALSQLNQQLATTGAQLNDSQTNSLMQIYAEERPKSPASPFKSGSAQGMNLSPEELEQFFQQQAELNERVRTRAMSLLTPQQMEQFKAQQNQNLELQKMGLKMAKQMLGK